MESKKKMKNCCILFKYEEMIIYVKLMNFYVNKTRENNIQFSGFQPSDQSWVYMLSNQK